MRADHGGAARRASGGWTATARIAFARRDTDWHTVADEREAFYLRIAGPANTATRGRTWASW